MKHERTGTPDAGAPSPILVNEKNAAQMLAISQRSLWTLRNTERIPFCPNPIFDPLPRDGHRSIRRRAGFSRNWRNAMKRHPSNSRSAPAPTGDGMEVSRRRKKRGRGNGEGSLYKRDKGRGTEGPWYLSWYDERGKRREACAKTTDRATAGRMLAKRVEEVAKRRDGIVTPAEAMIADAGVKPLSVHLDDYAKDCLREGQNAHTSPPKLKCWPR